MVKVSGIINALARALLLVYFLFPQVAIAQIDCELKKENEDLKVYTCDSGNEKLKILRAELLLRNTSFEKLLHFVEDIDNYVNWQYNTIEAKLLKKTQQHWLRYYMVVDAPWPLSDRELIAEMNSRFDTLTQILYITTRSIVPDAPVDENMVRIPFSEGNWRITPFNKTSLKIYYTLRIDPGGNVPAWLANMAMAEGPYYSFTKLKEQLQQ